MSESNLARCLELPAPTRCRAKVRRILGQASQPPQAPPSAAGRPTHDAKMHNALTHVERASMLILSIHGFLLNGGHKDLARAAWIAYSEASDGAEGLSDYLGVEPLLD